MDVRQSLAKGERDNLRAPPIDQIPYFVSELYAAVLEFGDRAVFSVVEFFFE